MYDIRGERDHSHIMTTQIPEQLLFFRHSPVTSHGVCYGQSEQQTTDTADVVADLFLKAYQAHNLHRNLEIQSQGQSQGQSQDQREGDGEGISRALTQDICIWSSPAPRCERPATLIARRLSLGLKVDARLFEINFGAWEGLTWDEIERAYPQKFQHWMDHWKTAAPPRGESVSQFQSRVCDWLTHLDPECVHIIIGHAGVLRALHVALQLKTWDEAMSMSAPHLTLLSIL